MEEILNFWTNYTDLITENQLIYYFRIIMIALSQQQTGTPIQSTEVSLEDSIILFYDKVISTIFNLYNHK